MSTHKPGYLIGVFLLTLILSIPLGMQCYPNVASIWAGVECAYHGIPLLDSISQTGLLPRIPGLSSGKMYCSEFSYAKLWRDRFVRVHPDISKWKAKNITSGVVDDWTVSLADPETGTESVMEWGLTGEGFAIEVLGDRLFFCGRQKQFEVVDGALQPADLPMAYDSSYLLLNGEIAQIKRTTGTAKFSIFLRQSGTWGNEAIVVLPTGGRDWTLGTTTIDFDQSSKLECINQGDLIHTFLHVNGHLLYRQGLMLRKANGEGEPWVVGGDGGAATDDELAGWSLVRDEVASSEPDDDQFATVAGSESNACQHGTLVDGSPGALIVDKVETRDLIGHLYKFDGTEWSRVATVPFPFGSSEFRAIARGDNRSPYIVATTSAGFGNAYVTETTGIRQVKDPRTDQIWPHIKRQLTYFGYCWANVLGLALLPGVGIWILMAWCTKPQYGFGLKTVKLASIGRRGIARLIDIALIALSAAFVGWGLTRGFDWLTLAEAVKLKLDHPTIDSALRALLLLALWLAIAILALVIVQGGWGVTPGKWVCGLRTLRTTLRPCGIVRSLVREVVFAFDSCYLLCWVPGILSIAISQLRQRLGDLVADTIVVESKSLKSGAETA